jgi:D-amino-acid dehydrogenase
MSDTKKIVIVGSGVIGSFAAYFLAGTNPSVTVVDKGCFGEGASSGNCGLIVPNHIFPLNVPSNLLKALVWMLKEDAPLHVKPQFDVERYKWFVNFARRCRRKNIVSSAVARHALLKSSFSLYPQIIDHENIACSWKIGGSIHAYQSASQWEAFRTTDARLSQYGVVAEQLDRNALRSLAPALGKDLAGGWYYRDTAQLRPEELLHGMHQLLAEKGVRIIENTEVKGFVIENDRAVGVRAEAETISADDVVVATGAWTPMFEKSLGCRIPIQPGKGYSMTMKRPGNCPDFPIFFEEKSVVATPWPSEFRLGGTMEFAGVDSSLNRKRLAVLIRAAGHYLDDFKAEHIKEKWCGFRPMTYDGVPIIDRSPRLKNVMIAAGHNMVGLSMGPGTGKLVAEILNGDTPHVDPRPYRVGRFGA